MTSQVTIPPAPTALSPGVSPVRIGIIVGSTRPGRKAELVARWVHEIAAPRDDARFDVLDLADFGLPLLDEPMPPMSGQVTHHHTHAWAAAVDACDGFVFVTPEYNHSTSAALKNAIDFLFTEWNDKVCADVRSQVALNLASIGVDEVNADPRTQQRLSTMLDETVAWGIALRQLRALTVAG